MELHCVSKQLLPTPRRSPRKTIPESARGGGAEDARNLMEAQTCARSQKQDIVDMTPRCTGIRPEIRQAPASKTAGAASELHMSPRSSAAPSEPAREPTVPQQSAMYHQLPAADITRRSGVNECGTLNNLTQSPAPTSMQLLSRLTCGRLSARTHAKGRVLPGHSPRKTARSTVTLKIETHSSPRKIDTARDSQNGLSLSPRKLHSALQTGLEFLDEDVQQMAAVAKRNNNVPCVSGLLNASRDAAYAAPRPADARAPANTQQNAQHDAHHAKQSARQSGKAAQHTPTTPQQKLLQTAHTSYSRAAHSLTSRHPLTRHHSQAMKQLASLNAFSPPCAEVPAEPTNISSSTLRCGLTASPAQQVLAARRRPVSLCRDSEAKQNISPVTALLTGNHSTSASGVAPANSEVPTALQQGSARGNRSLSPRRGQLRATRLSRAPPPAVPSSGRTPFG